MTLTREQRDETRKTIDVWVSDMIEASLSDSEGKLGSWSEAFIGGSEYYFVLGIMTALKKTGQISQHTFDRFEDMLHHLWGQVKRGENYDAAEYALDSLLDEIFSDGQRVK